MSLPKSNAKNVEERMSEITSSNSHDVISYEHYDYTNYKLIKVNPFGQLAENIRFYPDGLEVLIEFSESEQSENKVLTYTHQLINEARKGILTYKIRRLTNLK